jgi:hypothetical protein
MGLVLFRQLLGGTEDAEILREFSRCWRIDGGTNNYGTTQPLVSKGTSYSNDDTPGIYIYIYTRRVDTIGSRQSIVCHLLLSRKHGYRE